ncbi:uncharacterized protein TrAtP1_007785 [Trichoderma atroviride]|uniref:uncharacterized protein n=1 Tax=Hypocrea atroviridis TaxID=63577 RepID=UPI003331C8A5|nr:hypothetical protein TrAtP1_007785 [Trichoderma atroviride]
MMNKFNGPEDPDYQCVVGKIEEILQGLRTNSPLDDADAWIRNKHYAVDKLKIERLSGDLLPMDQCYINFAVVEQHVQDSDRPMTEDTKASPFSLFNRQKIETPDTTVQVELATIFSQRQERNGEMIQPRRILIRGRAGVGKTTLCKKIVHEFTQGTWSGWNDLFDRILWVPLRNLKLEERRQHPAYDFEALLTHQYFSLPNNKPDFAKHLAQALESSSSRTLFLLDGLDEVSQELAGGNSMSRFLNELLEQPNIIVTSRPSGRLPLNLDLELEAIGFYPDQVKNYIRKTFTNPKTTEIDEKTVGNIQSFLQNHWLIQGLVRIPIQLDALCYTWRDIRSDMPETMTALYQTIELSLWKKDVVRLEKKHNDRLVTPYHIQYASQQKIEELVKDEISFLESLAFAGLCSDMIEFESKHLNFISDHFPGFLLDKAASSLSFLRASNPSSENCNRSYHFIHLTFQEYFAARCFVRQWTAREPLDCVELGSRNVNKIEPAEFFQKHKYTARYDILWRFVAGLLDAEPEGASLFFQKIEEEPLDFLGPAHQRLVMHCLSEVSSNFSIRADLEQRLSKWLLFECEIAHGRSSHLASEVEFPELALDTAFREASDKVKKMILRSFTKGATAPMSIIELAISWLSRKNSSAQMAAVKALQQLALPDRFLRIIAARLEDKDLVRKATLRILCKQPNLPKEILEAIAAILEDKNPSIRQVTVETLGKRLALPDEILKAIAARLEDKNPSIRQVTVETLGKRLALPDEILKAMAARLEDKNLSIRQATVKTLGQRFALPNEILEALAARLEDEHPDVRYWAVQALGERSTLPNEILKAIAARLEDESQFVQETAVEALVRQLILPEEILETMAARLEDEDWRVRQTTIKGLGLFKRLGLQSKRLEDIATRLKTKDWSIRQAAFGALNQHFSLSDEALKTIAAQLQHNDNSYIRVSAIETLGNQSSLPYEILQAIATQLKENENISVQIAAIEALASQSNLPTEILQVMTAKLEDNEDYSIHEAAIQALSMQSSITDKILKVITALLNNNKVNFSLKEVAIIALYDQLDLPREIIHALAARLKDNDPYIQSAAIKVLGSQPMLPKKYLNDIAAQLDNDSSWVVELAEETLRKRKDFYPTLFKGPYAPSLYQVLLRRSFGEEISWCVDNDGSSFINMPEDGGRLVIGEQYDMKAIIKEIRPANYPVQ